MIQLNYSDIGIAILSTERSNCLARILSSMNQYENLNNLHIFVCDDSEDSTPNQSISSRYNAHLVDTGNHIGIAKNTNCAIDCLNTYPFKLIFNSDMIVKRQGWVFVYPINILRTGIHCFSFRQLGLWGACKEGETGDKPDTRWTCNGIEVATVSQKPQGCLLAFDQHMIDEVGYFDTDFTGYGYSHHLWAEMAGLQKIQPEGFHDINNSNDYFYVYDEVCVTPHSQRVADYKRNHKLYLEKMQSVQR